MNWAHKKWRLHWAQFHFCLAMIHLGPLIMAPWPKMLHPLVPPFPLTFPVLRKENYLLWQLVYFIFSTIFIFFESFFVWINGIFLRFFYSPLHFIAFFLLFYFVYVLVVYLLSLLTLSLIVFFLIFYVVYLY